MGIKDIDLEEFRMDDEKGMKVNDMQKKHGLTTSEYYYVRALAGLSVYRQGPRKKMHIYQVHKDGHMYLPKWAVEMFGFKGGDRVELVVSSKEPPHIQLKKVEDSEGG